jgi:hypothetical protein
MTILKGLNWVIALILGLAYLIVFILAIFNYSEISQWIGSSSIIGGIFATLFQIWVWITAFVLIYCGLKKTTEKATDNPSQYPKW